MIRLKYIILILLILIIAFASIAIWYIYPSKIKRHRPLIAIYPSAVDGHDPCNNTEMFMEDLDLIKFLGFEGVRIHPKDFEKYGYGRVADDLRERRLKFVMVLRGWNDSRFPDNDTYRGINSIFLRCCQTVKV